MARRKKEEAKAVIEPKIIDSNLEEIVADRFSRYSKYIIQERALPDARDGLKPVQRRIMWAMQEDGNTYNKPYRKSARTVGNVIGNYHPHGDTSVYDAIVRLSQDWKSNLPLIDMQGNNGSIDDDPAAAMRYTEARLSKIASYLLEDIDKETVEWSPNFSDEKLEPTVLPARYPNLLINGITGIAAGYATNIPPHNFNEVMDATMYRIDHPDCSIDEILEIVKGPDFPTGGIIVGTEGIREALTTGKGRITIRSKAEIVEGKTINQIVIHEIPYEVVKGALVRKMDDIRLNGKVSGLLDVRDESDRKGMRIVCDLKKEANAQAILNYLYRNTDLQSYYHYNVIAIVNRTPRQLSILQMLDAFIAHRDEVIVNRSQYDLKRKKDRLHIVEGLQQAVSILDEIVATIRKSNGKADSKAKIIEKYGFSEAQAEAIVTMQLYRLSNTDIIALENEETTLRKEIEYLEGIINQPTKRKKLMKKELKELNEMFVMPRRTTIQEEVEDIVVNDRDMIVDEQVVVTVSRHGYIKRVSMRSFASSQNGKSGLKEGDEFVLNSPASTLDNVLIFTNQGRFGLIPVYQIEEKKWKELGNHFSSLVKTETGEQIVQVFLEKEQTKDLDLIFMTKKGLMRRIHREELQIKITSRLIQLMSLVDDDALAFVLPSYHVEDDLLIISKNGFGFKMHAIEIPVSKGKGKGVKGMKIQGDDEVIALFGCDEEYLVLENESGQLKKLAISAIDYLKRGAKGARLFKPVKSKPTAILSCTTGSNKATLPFVDSEIAAVDISALKKMDPASTWSSHVIEPATPFEQVDIRLHNGARDEQARQIEEQNSKDSLGKQLSLFE